MKQLNRIPNSKKPMKNVRIWALGHMVGRRAPHCACLLFRIHCTFLHLYLHNFCLNLKTLGAPGPQVPRPASVPTTGDARHVSFMYTYQYKYTMYIYVYIYIYVYMHNHVYHILDGIGWQALPKCPQHPMNFSWWPLSELYGHMAPPAAQETNLYSAFAFLETIWESTWQWKTDTYFNSHEYTV